VAEDLDDELRALVSAVVGRVREPVGRSLHLHQLDGARMEAMVYLDVAGARVAWVHGKGDCAITGEGSAILAVLRDGADARALAEDGRLVLYGDLGLVAAAADIFRIAG
jgi:ubiquinone biosynthesis protein UbiJ